MDNERIKRKKDRLQERDYRACGAYFITVCTTEKRSYFGEPAGAGGMLSMAETLGKSNSLKDPVGASIVYAAT